jgi:glycosyltransferase involved in cell wall biosynthesis
LQASNINLSYIIATRNRLDFLRITLSKLLANLQSDEEVIIVDGASTDGSREYLQELFEKGLIHQYISEPDRNQSHAWNKAMLMANGILIKKIIDDDVFCYNAIRQCKKYMLRSPDIDLCLSNTLGSNLLDYTTLSVANELNHFRNWKAGKIPSFAFSDSSVIIRRESLSFLGFYDTQFKMMDWEYSLRVTFLGANIAYYTGYNALSVYTPGNISSTATKEELKREGKIGQVKYRYIEGYQISAYSRIKIFIGKAVHRLSKKRGDPRVKNAVYDQDLVSIYSKLYHILNSYFSDNDNFIV